MNIHIKDCPNCSGADHDWDYGAPTLKELRRIKAVTSLGLRDFGDGVVTADADALTALVDLLHRRDGVELRWDDIDLNFDGFEITPNAEETAEAGKDGPAEAGTPTENAT